MQSAPLKITIVTPSYNQGPFLERTLRSILDQNAPHLQYIVVDGASDDDSPAIIQKYADQLAWSVSEKDKGHADAINKGFSRSDGDVMAWLNSDDMYFPWTLQLVREIFEKFPDVEWLTGIPVLWNSNDQLIDNHKGEAYINKWDFMGGRYQWIQQESTFWRRSLWNKAGGRIDDSGTLMIDGELWTRFFKHAELWRIETLLGGYRLHGTNRAHTSADQVEIEMKTFCDMLRREANQAEKKTLDEYLALAAENRTGEIHHPCCRYPVIRWSMVTNSWEKDVVFKRHGWSFATTHVVEPKLQFEDSNDLTYEKLAYHFYRSKWTEVCEKSLFRSFCWEAWLYKRAYKRAKKKLKRNRQFVGLSNVLSSYTPEAIEAALFAFHDRRFEKIRRNTIPWQLRADAWVARCLRDRLAHESTQ